MLGDPHLGYRLGLLVSLDDLDVYGAAIAHARTLGEAISIGARYVPVWEQGVRWSIEHDGDRALVVYENTPTADLVGAAIDSQESIVFIGRAIVRACPALRFPIELHCVGAPPPLSSALLDGVSGKLVLRFEQSRWGVGLATADLGAPMRPQHPAVAPLLQAHLEKTFVDLRTTTSLQARLASELRRVMAQGCDQTKVATALGLSPRTLQRELHALGTSYSEELAAVRVLGAEDLLANTALPMKEVAARLGFSSVATFSRFFRQRTGQSPSTFRDRRPE